MVHVAILLISEEFPYSEIFILAFGEGHFGGLVNLSLKSTLEFIVEMNLGGGEEGCFSKGKAGIVDEAAEEPDEGLFELVVGLGGDVIVLEILLAVEGDLLGFHFAVLHVDLVSNKHNWDVLANTS